MKYKDLRKPKPHTRWFFLSKDLGIETYHMAYGHPNGTTVVSDAVETQRGYEWHLSISKNGKYPSPSAVRLVRKEFGVEDFEQDDHSVIIASLWQPFNEDKRGDCECKD